MTTVFGSEFQTAGAEHRKARLANVVVVLWRRVVVVVVVFRHVPSVSARPLPSPTGVGSRLRRRAAEGTVAGVDQRSRASQTARRSNKRLLRSVCFGSGVKR